MRSTAALLFLFMLNVSAFADHPSYRILIIDSQLGEPYTSFREHLVDSLTEKTAAENSTISIEFYSLGNQVGAAQRIWNTEQHNQYAAVVIQGTIAAIAFQEMVYGDPAVPVFFGSVTDPVGIGIIDGLDKPPPANFTGIAYPVPAAERLRFVTTMMPDARNIGLIFSDMPQSRSYIDMIYQAVQEEDLRHLCLHIRSVPFVPGEDGLRRSVVLARQHVAELDPIVDVFLAPNDQMGAQEPFQRMVFNTASSPLVGLGSIDIQENWGAVMSMYPSTPDSAKTLADMLYRYLHGTPFSQLYPQASESNILIDRNKAKRFNITIPEQYNTPEVLYVP